MSPMDYLVLELRYTPDKAKEIMKGAFGFDDPDYKPLAAGQVPGGGQQDPNPVGQPNSDRIAGDKKTGKAADKDGPYSNIHMHLSNIRKKLAPKGQNIIAEYNRRRVGYRHVVLLASTTDGKT